ncbi:MAG TPA: hypothetical protein VFB14_28160 [Bryobacteraceae bacterium]|nr:hypothetical protein [Bryobacteraceae bacterium]
MRLANRFFFVSSLTFVVAAGLLGAPPQARGHAGGAHAVNGRSPAGLPPIYGISGPAPIGGVGPAPIGGVGRIGPAPSPGFGFGNGYRSGVYTGRSNGGYAERGRRGRNAGWGLPFAYFMAPYYYPDLAYDSSFEPPPPVDGNAQAAVMAENRLGEQIQRLTAEIEELRNAQQSDYSSASEAPPMPPAPPIVLVLRDGQQLKTDNYAVMNNTLWDFSKQPARRIPLSSINVPASEKASEANGAEFPQIPTP